MRTKVLVVGGGIGGLAAAWACTRAGCETQVLEQAPVLSEVGAGIQLGPNVTRIIEAWGLGPAMRAVTASPGQLRVRDGATGAQLASLRFGEDFLRRYGAPYLTVHRADLQALLLEAVRSAGAGLALSTRVASATPAAKRVQVSTDAGGQWQADALIAADGVWSGLRERVDPAGPALWSGHLAYRTLTDQSALPEALRSSDVTVWMAPRMHLVCYPVRGGDQLNVVAIVEAGGRGGAQDWDQKGSTGELLAAMGPICGGLRALVEAMPAWRLWALHDRPPLRGPHQMALGRIALLGDAAHPMLPYLAQGAGMAIEDADRLGGAMAAVRDAHADVPSALHQYALDRWARCARVQGGARRNATIFHARGPMRWGRDLALRTLGERLLDQPWLYGVH